MGILYLLSYTTVAWLSCMIFVYPMKKRFTGIVNILLSVVAYVFISAVQIFIGCDSLIFALITYCSLIVVIYTTCRIKTGAAVYIALWAYYLHDFINNIELQFIYGVKTGFVSETATLVVTFIIGVGVCIAAAYFVARGFKGNESLLSDKKAYVISIGLGAGTFFLMYMHEIVPGIGLVVSDKQQLAYMRALTSFAAMVCMYVIFQMVVQVEMRGELVMINRVLKDQYDQYRISKENVEIINRKCHDLKHQIAAIAAETDVEKREEYLGQITGVIDSYQATYKTGNDILDTILTSKSFYCMKHEINFSCVVDGEALQFIETIDLCTLFGNALDNAIEGVLRIKDDKERRIIRVAVFKQTRLVVLRFENYCVNELTIKDGHPVTSKENKEYHGYGVKSMEYVAEKYGGSLNLNLKDGWVTLSIVIPEPEI